MDTLLLVEDEYPIARLLQVYLEKAGYRSSLGKKCRRRS